MMSRELHSRIAQAVDAGFDDQLAFTQALVRHPSVRGREATAQDFMARAMRKRGLAVDRWRIDPNEIRHMPGFSPITIPYDNTYNVVGAHRARSQGGDSHRSLILNGHVDVVPPGPADRWSRPPFDPEIVDGWMHGRGSGDMKAGLAATLAALDALARLGYRPASDVYVQSVVEEECTGNGALACLARGYHADAALIPEPVPGLLRAQVGVMWFSVEVNGDPQHASGAYSPGVNAIDKAIEVIGQLRSLERDWNAEKSEHPPFADHHHPINFNLGTIEGGEWVSSVPSRCTFDMRIGLYPGWSLEQVRRAVETRLAEIADGDPYLAQHPPCIRYNGFQAEGYVLPQDTEAETLLRAIHDATRDTPLEEIASSATTDARFFGLYSDTIPLVYGPLCVGPHGIDERVELESVRAVTKVMALFIAEWCGLEDA